MSEQLLRLPAARAQGVGDPQADQHVVAAGREAWPPAQQEIDSLGVATPSERGQSRMENGSEVNAPATDHAAIGECGT